MAAAFKRSTLKITEHKDANPLLWYSLPSVVPTQALPNPGGLGSRTSDEDHECALAGAAAV
ncbi:MAG TPA: hypothetical protein EYQ42_12175 [Thiotrichaceae bacterium]|jgi:uncharacterized protein GlcG (DUF336 family)|nr:hypothetical protein [Thiotrichaceae bacterium]